MKHFYSLNCLNVFDYSNKNESMPSFILIWPLLFELSNGQSLWNKFQTLFEMFSNPFITIAQWVPQGIQHGGCCCEFDLRVYTSLLLFLLPVLWLLNCCGLWQRITFQWLQECYGHSGHNKLFNNRASHLAFAHP